MMPVSVGRLRRAARIALIVGVWLAPAALSAQSLSKGALSFGKQVVSLTSTPRPVSFKNTLLVPVTLTSVAVSGGNSGDFVATPACVLPAVIQPGNTCAVAVRFTPGALGTRSSTLIFAHNGPAGPLSVVLTGTGVLPVTLTSSLSFGSVSLGLTSASKTATLTNLQPAPLSIASMTLPLPFVRTGGTCPAGAGVLAAGASCTILVAFAPTVAVTTAGSLTVTHDATNSPQSVALSGKGVAPVTTSPSSLSFTSRTVGTPSTPKNVIVSNRLSSPLALGGVAAAGDFAVSSSTCGASLPVGGQCVIGVTFTPTALGARTGTLSIVHGAFGSPLQIALSGTGNVTGLVSLAVTPPSPSIPVGVSVPFAAVGTFSSGTSTPLTTSVAWSVSGSPGVASISNSAGTQGVAQGSAAGTVTVTATLGAIAGSTQLTVTSGTPVWIDVTPSGASLGLGLTQQFTATATFGGGGTGNVTATAEWDLEFPTRGRVNETGLYTALASGSNAVSAALGAVEGQASVSAAAPVFNHRQQATATRLLDGRVLITGGIDSCCTVSAQTEIFDPATGTFTAAVPMSTTRRKHSAALLPDGRVLVAGGIQNDFSIVATAEIFDPVLGTWSPTGSMNANRAYHSATLVGTKVLIAGGDNGSVTLASTEVFDPSTGTFTYSGSLTTARQSHRAARLPDGRVLVAGGTTGAAETTLASAELYNPASGSWAPTGAMTTPRVRHTATLLTSNRVLVVGGSPGAAPNLSSAELFNPATGTWSATGPIDSAVSDHTASLLASGQVLVAGGGGMDLTFTAVYDPPSGTFAPGPPLAFGRRLHAASELNDGSVLLVGGSGPVSGGPGAQSAELRREGAVLTGLTIDRVNQWISHPATLDYKAIGTFSDGSRGDVSGSVTWSVTPASVASIHQGFFPDGTMHTQLTTWGPGTATVRATLGSVSFETMLVVN
jgi:hypothetical protein